MKYIIDNLIKKNKKILLIQLSPPHTGSTVLVNILYGLLFYDKPINYDYEFFTLLQNGKINNNDWKRFENDYLSGDINIIKTHNLCIDKISNTFEKKYDIFFICSERDKSIINPKYHLYKNVIMFKYDDLLESTSNSIENIVSNIANRLKIIFPKSIELNEKDAIYRIKNMNTIYELIQNKPFTYYSKFYHLHGSHKNRIHNYNK
jgi:hypothetical protein